MGFGILSSLKYKPGVKVVFEDEVGLLGLPTASTSKTPLFWLSGVTVSVG